MMRTIVLGMMFALACGSASGPVEPVWGKQPCAHCMMLLSDRHSAAQAQLSDGSHAFFDDIGCMFEWLAREERAVRSLWVRRPSGDAWSAAEVAHYEEGHRTPMDYGVLPALAGMSFEQARKITLERAARRSPVRP